MESAKDAFGAMGLASPGPLLDAFSCNGASDSVHRRRLDILVVQRQVRGFFFWYRKLWSFRSCCSSLAVDIPFVPQKLIPMVQSAQQIMEILQLLLFWWSMSLLCGSCRFSGAAVEKTLALPQLQLVEKSDSFYDPSNLAVTCLVFARGVQDYGLLWEKTSRYAVFSASWFNSGYMSASVNVVVFLAGNDAPRAVFPCSSAFRRRQQWQYLAFTGDEAPRVIFLLASPSPDVLCILAGMDQKDCYDMVHIVPDCKLWSLRQLQSIFGRRHLFRGAEAVFMVQTVRQTIDFLQLLYKVVDVLVCMSCRFPCRGAEACPMVQTVHGDRCACCAVLQVPGAVVVETVEFSQLPLLRKSSFPGGPGQGCRHARWRADLGQLIVVVMS